MTEENLSQTVASRRELIHRLATQGPVNPYPLYGLLSLWWLASWGVTLLLIHLTGELRPGWAQQLLSAWRFALETGLGVAAGLLLGAAAFQAAVPAASRRLVIILGAAAILLWVASLVAGMQYPALAPTMAGKREHCTYEILLFSLPALGLGFWLLKRGYVLHWGWAGFGLGLAAGLIPATIMQVACVYLPLHMLGNHLGPALVVAVVGALVGMGLNHWDPSNKPIS